MEVPGVGVGHNDFPLHFFYIYVLLFNYMRVCVRGSVHMRAGIQGDQKMTPGPLLLE